MSDKRILLYNTNFESGQCYLLKTGGIVRENSFFPLHILIMNDPQRFLNASIENIYGISTGLYTGMRKKGG